MRRRRPDGVATWQRGCEVRRYGEARRQLRIQNVIVNVLLSFEPSLQNSSSDYIWTTKRKNIVRHICKSSTGSPKLFRFKNSGVTSIHSSASEVYTVSPM
jgi:hypothetical protein